MRSRRHFRPVTKEFAEELSQVIKSKGNYFKKVITNNITYVCDADIDDILQNAATKALRYHQTFDREKGAFDVWFARIVARSAIAFAINRRRTVGTTGLDLTLQLIEMHLYQCDPWQDAADVQDARRLHKLSHIFQILNAFSDEDRRILQARIDAHGSPWTAPLAEELGISAATLRVRATRLIDHIREHLNALGLVTVS